MAVVASWKVDRGRTTEMDRTSTGVATVEMIDLDHSADPASGNGSSPGTPVALGLGGQPIFTGFVRRWNYDPYQDGHYAVATVECEDGMGKLSRTEMVADSALWGGNGAVIYNGNIWFSPASQMKIRVDQILTQAGWALGAREVFTGNVDLLQTVYAPGQSALAAIWDALEAEFPGIANGFISKDGKFVAHGRLARFNPTDAQYHITTWEVGDLPNAAGKAVVNGLGPYGLDGDRIINQAFCTPEGVADSAISGQYIRDQTSIDAHGVYPWSAENLIIDHSWLTGRTGLSECKHVFAQYFVDNYAEPDNELRNLTFKWQPPGSSSYATATNAMIAGIDISDRIHLTTANGFDYYGFVEGLHYEAKPASDQYHDVTLNVDLSPATHWSTLPS